jgi:hypothetical protein
MNKKLSAQYFEYSVVQPEGRCSIALCLYHTISQVLKTNQTLLHCNLDWIL